MILIKNTNIHDGLGHVSSETDLLTEDNRIVKIGKNLNVENAKIIDGTGLELFPGFIDPLSLIGSQDITYRVRDNDENENPLNPLISARYAFNPSEVMMEGLYEVGVTTIGVTPGNNNVIGGQMAAFHTFGDNVNKMILKSITGIKGCVSTQVKETYGSKDKYPKTRMGTFQLLEEFLESDYDNLKERKLIDQILDGTIPLFIWVNTASEIDALLYILRNKSIKLVLCGAFEFDRCIDEIIDRNVSVIIGDQISLSNGSYYETKLERLSKIKVGYGQVGITTSNLYGASGKVHYLWNATRLYKSGIDKEEVLSMLTSQPAQLLGIDNEFGTIEVGKRADFCLYRNNPIIRFDAVNLMTVIDGEIIYKVEGVKNDY